MELAIVWMNGDYVSEYKIAKHADVRSLPRELLRNVTLRRFPCKKKEPHWFKILQPMQLQDIVNKNQRYLEEDETMLVVGLWTNELQRKTVTDCFEVLRLLYPKHMYTVASRSSCNKKLSLRRLMAENVLTGKVAV